MKNHKIYVFSNAKIYFGYESAAINKINTISNMHFLSSMNAYYNVSTSKFRYHNFNKCKFIRNAKKKNVIVFANLVSNKKDNKQVAKSIVISNTIIITSVNLTVSVRAIK